MVTAHSPENVGVKTPLRNILETLGEIYKKYEKALKEYQKTKPLTSRGRHILRDIMLAVLPKSVSGSILKSYMNMKEK